jgi:hypothetical protein
MSWIRHNGTYPTGSGEKDRKVADALFNAPTKQAAEQATREIEGHSYTAEESIAWLASRSDPPWVG